MRAPGRVVSIGAAALLALPCMLVPQDKAGALDGAIPPVFRADETQQGAGRGDPPSGVIDVRDRTTRSLYAACLAAQAAPSSWCSAYLMGVADTLTALGEGGHKGGICNVDYTIEQLVETFLTWARANDTLLGFDMLAGASLAFRRRWPCR